MTEQEAKRQAIGLVSNNRGDGILIWAITAGLLEAFEAGVLAERERQAIARNEGSKAGRGG